MVATAIRHDDLPTTPFPALRRQLPPPLPRPQSQYQLAPARKQVDVPFALRKGKVVIELPLDVLADHEIAQITAWLRGRASYVEVRRPVLARAAERVLKLARSTRARVLEAVQVALSWTLLRISRVNGLDLPDAPRNQRESGEVASAPPAGSAQ